MTVEFITSSGGREIEVFDPIMRHRVRLEFPSAVEPVPADGDTFTFPVEQAVAVETERVGGEAVTLAIFDEAGHRVESIWGNESGLQLDPGTYQFSIAEGMKLYLHAHAPEGATVASGTAESGEIAFGTETRVTIGSRSLHERPAGTVTTTESPADMMTALSSFGSALKDTSPMRSFVTLRGHPPAVELGEQLDVPSEFSPPDTGIRIELPRERRLVYAAAPLAYYLGAELVPGETPRIVTDAGYEHSLDGWSTTDAIDAVLRDVFFLDSLVREDDPFCGEYAGRDRFESASGIDLDGLYDLPLAARLREYLEMPTDVRERFRLNWHLGARMSPRPASVEHLPALAYRLATVHPTAGTVVASSVSDLPDPDGGRSSAMGGRPLPPGTGPAPNAVVSPNELDVARQTWVGDGTPIGAAEHDVAAARRGRNRTPIDGDIRYVVVCNDDRMAEEDEAVRDLLAQRGGLDFEAESYRNLPAAELRELLGTDIEFFHFVGHADERGFECADGHLDPSTIETVGADVFFLNSCLSYDAGRQLIETGALAGVVTLGEVQNSVATEMGRHVATLVNGGIQVGAAVAVAADACDAERYTVIGDDAFKLVNVTAPGVDAVASADEETVRHTYHPASIALPHISPQWVTVDAASDRDTGGSLFLDADVSHRCAHDIDDYFDDISGDNAPIWLDGDLHRLDELSPDDLLD